MHASSLITAVAALLSTVSAIAQSQLVVPPGYATTEGDSNGLIPWNFGTYSSRIQFVYDSSTFTLQGVTTPVLIQRIRYRPNAEAAWAAWPGGSWQDVRIDMATCTNDYLALSTWFANNQGPDLRTVHHGPVVVQPGVGIGASVPQPWYIDIPFSAPFLYDPVAGDLLVDVQVDGTGWSGLSWGADHVSSAGPHPPLCSRVLDGGYVSPNRGAVCEFSFVPPTGLHPAFRATPATGVSPLLVQFTDWSFTSDPNGILSWSWDFNGDGVIDSTAQNPSHTYGCGDFTVTLTVVDGLHGSRTLTKASFVRTDSLTARFTTIKLAGGQYQFLDASTPVPTTWAWDFDNDGVVDSTTQNPITALRSCSTTTRLVVSRACRTASARNVVLVTPANLSANLTGGNGWPSLSTVGNLFDVQVLASEGVLVCGLTSATYSGGGAYTVTVWVTPDSYVGKDADVAQWRQVASGKGTMNGGGTNPPSLNQVVLWAPFYLPQGKYGIAVYHASEIGASYIAHTHAQAGPYANADLSIHPVPAVAPGLAKNQLFGGNTSASRQWNGTFHYTKVALDQHGGHGFFGLGCAGSAGVPGNIAVTEPAIGTTFTIVLTNLAQNVALYWWGFSRTTSWLGLLPFDMAGLGAPGCFARVSVDSGVVLTGTGGTATFHFAIPANPALLGVQYYSQALSPDPAANALGMVASDAAGFIVGQ